MPSERKCLEFSTFSTWLAQQNKAGCTELSRHFFGSPSLLGIAVFPAGPREGRGAGGPQPRAAGSCTAVLPRVWQQEGRAVKNALGLPTVCWMTCLARHWCIGNVIYLLISSFLRISL